MTYTDYFTNVSLTRTIPLNSQRQHGVWCNGSWLDWENKKKNGYSQYLEILTRIGNT